MSHSHYSRHVATHVHAYHVLKVIIAKSFSEVVEHTRTILLELEMTRKVFPVNVQEIRNSTQQTQFGKRSKGKQRDGRGREGAVYLL